MIGVSAFLLGGIVVLVILVIIIAVAMNNR